MASLNESTRWFVRRGKQVKGPFAVLQIKKYAALGRIKETDELSVDQQEWRIARACLELFPGGKLDALKLGPKDDERIRNSQVNVADGTVAAGEQGLVKDRRAKESPEVVQRREQRERVLQSLWLDKQSNRFPALVVIALVITIGVAGWFLTPTEQAEKPDCESPAQVGVNWENCRMENVVLEGVDLSSARLRNIRMPGAQLLGVKLDMADLAYAHLLQANLSYTSLQKTSFKGSNLKFADLSNANLAHADLSYADLTNAKIGGADFTGAILSNTIWIDGQLCARDAIGSCTR